MILFYDTETTGLPDFKARSADPLQPHMVQIALLFTDDDGTELELQTALIRPDDWQVPEEGPAAVHGISHARCMEEGIPESAAANMFLLAQARCNLRVAHNESFDRRILRIAMTRAGIERDVIEATENRSSFDTCRAAQPIVNLPPTSAMVAKGMTSAKPPKLTECISFFFQDSIEGAHDAVWDARACARIYFHLQSLNRAAIEAEPATIKPLTLTEGAAAQ